MISSKTALLKQMLDNPEIAFAVREMPMSEALSFLFGSVGLQATMSEDVLELDTTVTMSVQASAIAIIDSLLEQQELAIVYDPAIEVAQVYTQAEFDTRLNDIKSSIEAYNGVLRDKKALQRVQADRERVIEILGYVQLLLSGDDEGFAIGMDIHFTRTGGRGHIHPARRYHEKGHRPSHAHGRLRQHDRDQAGRPARTGGPRRHVRSRRQA